VTRRPFTRRPPARYCFECGERFYAWSGIMCRPCVRKLAVEGRPVESLREFRERLNREHPLR
jgi:hypothetical protein